MGELVDVGTSMDVAVFQDGTPVVICTLVQSQPNVVDCFFTSFGELDAAALAQLLQVVGEQLVIRERTRTDGNDDPFHGNADFDIPF